MLSPMATILIIEDELRLAEILEDYLRREGFLVERARDGLRGLERWRSAQPDLLLLDLMLPGLDGLELARRIRSSPPPAGLVPIIMLTARDDEVDKLVGLGLGADDYVTKPYSPREVVARVKAVLRRISQPPLAERQLQHGPLRLDLAGFEAFCDEQPLDLTVAELRVLAALLREPGRVRSRSELLVASEAGPEADERTIDAHVKNLRRKMAACGELLETVRGIGYKVKNQ
jgi:DNA-binding response OmpR family regulator